MFLRFLLKALQYRKQRLFLSFLALAVAAALATVLFGIYGTVETRMREQFRGFGANIVATPLHGTTLPLEVAALAERLGSAAAPFLVTSGRLAGNAVPVAGFFASKTAGMTSYWHMQGSRDIAAGECIAGELLAQKYQLAVGSSVPLEDFPCRLKGIVSTGGVEDQELLVPFEAAANVAGIQDAASLIEIRAPGAQVENVRSTLARSFPEASFRTIRAVEGTESNVILKIRASLFLLTLIILAITTLCVSSNFSEIVIERSKEIGILKALGGAERRIAAFFVSESAVLAIVATLVGYGIGELSAAAITRQIFGAVFHIQLSWLVLGAVAGVMLAIALFASGIAASRIWSIQPAVILRGE